MVSCTAGETKARRKQDKSKTKARQKQDTIRAKARRKQSEGEAPCRDMLLALVLEMITMAEGDPSSDSPTSGLHVLIEPVQIVADWDNALQFACFPSRDELLALPPLP